MKKRLSLALALIMVLVLVAGCGSPAPASAASGTDAQPAAAPAEKPVEPTLIRLSTSLAETNKAAEGLKLFKSEVEANSAGRLTVELYFNGQLSDSTQALPAIVKGNFEMTTSGPTYVVEYMPGYEFLSMGYLFRDYDHAQKVLSGELGEEIFQMTAEKTGLLPLCAFYLGARHIALAEDKEVIAPEDMAGLKIRTNGTEAYNSLVTAMGGSPVGIALGEMYTAVQTGTVDGYECPLSVIIGQSFYEVTKSISFTNHLVDMTWLSIGNEFYNSLSAEDQKVIMDAAKAACELNSQQTLKDEAEGEAFLTEKGVTLYKIDTSIMQSAVLNYNKEHQSGWDVDLLDRIQAVK